MRTARLTSIKSALTWTTPAGRELLRVGEGEKTAFLIANSLGVDGLRSLGEAALDAAQHIEDSEASLSDLIEQRR